MPGRVWEKAFEVAADRFGFITLGDFRRLGEDPARLRQWHKRGQVERVGHGIYRFPALPATPLDAYMLATLWPRGRGVISHDSALELHELCDINPVKIHLTVPPQMRLRRRGAEPYVVHKEHLEPGQIILYEGIRVVSPEHAILQGIASGVPRQLLEQALDTARRVGKLSAETLVEVEEKQRGSS